MNDDLELDMRSHYETEKLRQKIVMLGASNLSRSFPIAVSMTQQVFEGPLDFYVAKGHGRSYGKDSSCFGKKNSGIFSCGIWRALEQEKSMPITAFVTDIGNDLAYEVPVETVLEWVVGCLDRLATLDAQIVLCDLPVEALREVGNRKYRFFRTVLFPKCRLSWSAMLQRAEELSERLQEIASARKIPFFIGQKQWYRFDPIHPGGSFLVEMWKQILGEVTEIPGNLNRQRCSLAMACYLRGLRPESWSIFSVSRSAIQPNGHLCDGTKIALY